MQPAMWSRQTGLMTASDIATINRFVFRARRVAAHSLAQDRAELGRHVRGSLDGTLELNGRVTLVQRLPNEEAFESLAARLRPLTVRSEPIFYEKVFAALVTTTNDEHRATIAMLLREWQDAEIQGTQVQGFAMQQSNADGTDVTDFVSDTQLAAAWLYADLVHADASGPKAKALVFTMAERYSAAVRVFSRMALLTLHTLELIERMAATGLVTLASDALTGDVVIGKNELVREARAYVAEVGADLPDLRVSREWPEEWKAFTVTELRRQDPANRVRVTMRRADGSTIAIHDSAAIHRDFVASPAQWHVLVGGSLVFEFTFASDSESFTGARLADLRELTDTNELALSAAMLRLQMHDADAVVFGMGDTDLFELSGFTLAPSDLLQLQVIAEVLGDIAVIERLTGDQFELCDGRFTDTDRMSLRRARLLHEGKLIRSDRGPLRVTTDAERPPQVIQSVASTLNIGGAEVPVPFRYSLHPEMTGKLVESDAGIFTYSMSVPAGERFLEWEPEKRELGPDSDFTSVEPYNLLGISELEIG